MSRLNEASAVIGTPPPPPHAHAHAHTHRHASSISSPGAGSDSYSSVSGRGHKSISSMSSASSPRKKASPSDVIFGKPPGSDLASRAYEALNADGSSSSSSVSSGNGGIGSGSTQPMGKGISPIATASSSSHKSEGATNLSSEGSSSIDSETSHIKTNSSMSAQANSNDSDMARKRNGNGKETLSPTALEKTDVKLLPDLFEDADAEDIVVLVADMLTRLTTHNDQLPLHPTSLTRFHSRATPSITVLSYLKRITKYTSLEKSCTLILLIYIDRVCERISGFTICSLTVHRFICAAVVCASKALCDSFSTNGHYARVGGISLIELNMLEKEFLNIIDWKLSCSGALLQHYYTSLVDSHQLYRLKITPDEPANRDEDVQSTFGGDNEVEMAAS